MLQIYAAPGRGGVGKHRVRALGTGVRMVQQCCLEHRTAHLQTVHGCHRALRVEQNAAVPVHCSFGKLDDKILKEKNLDI